MKPWTSLSCIIAASYLLLAAHGGFAEDAITNEIAAQSGESPAGTAWKLVEINGLAVDRGDHEKAPYMVLQAGENQFGGYGGCNRFGGEYEISGERLNFSAIRATKMACPGTMELEARFMQALHQAARWKIEGERLHILAEDGSSLASFESFVLAGE